ncbi:MAG: filamentous hemagglutinin N-terminal domain-containing protein [Xanthomonadaceae bacterium]|nr:filamentous hemagglutinin N-terminal domain-containing protein [Xanthomonadaceae bacterium]
MHIPTQTSHRPSRRSHFEGARPPRRKALPLCLSMALAAGAMMSTGARAGSMVPGANAGTVSVSALTSPTGGTVVGGVGSISQSGGTTVINQLSNRLALDWTTFNVGKDATVLFKQPSFTAVALNRILDQNPSQIFGRINSNGQVFLINTHGIIFGTSAQVNVGGLVASTLDLTPSDFLANHFNLDAHGGSAGVVNHGTIAAASGGSVSLLGGSVANDGLILANYGNINLDGADRAVLDFDGNGLITVEVTGALKRRLDDRAAVSNSGTLEADGGTVVLQASAAKDLFTDAVNNSGVITAAGIRNDGGTVRLVASGGNAISSGSINVSGVHGGTAQVLSDANVGVTGSIDASGTQGGGTIRVGGGYQGGEGLTRANVTYLGPDAVLDADATQRGNGGSVVLWGDNGNNFYGSISARGGVLGGSGGRVETSSHYGLNAQGNVDASAANGAAGLWLIDPYNVTIQTGGGSLASPFTATADSTIKASDLDAALNGTNVTVFTGSAGSSNGDITVNAAVTPSAGNNSLYLEAAGGIFLNANITANTSHTLNLYLWSNYGGAAAGTTYTSNASCAAGVSCVVTVGGTSNAAISTGGGTLDIRTGTGGGTLTLGTGSKTGNINTAGGALTVHTTGITEVAGSNTIVAGTSTLDAGSGNITLGNANDFTVTVGLTAGNAQIEDANSLVLGNSTLSGSLTATAVTAITVNGAITGVGDAAFSTAALSGTGSIAGTGAITGLGSSNFALTGANAGTYGGIAFSGFASADATHVSGAAGFDDTALTSEGMTFASATHVAGTGTIANVSGSFADDTGTSSTSGIAYTGFGAVTGTGGDVTGVTGNFNLGTQVSSASGLDYSGFAVATVAGSGSGATLVGSGQTYMLDNATADKGSNGGIAWTGFGNIQDSTGTVVFGTGGNLSGSVTAKTLDYSSYGSAVNFDLSAGTGTTTGISGSWSGVTAVTGSAQGDTLAGTGQTYTLTGANAGNNGTVSWTSFENIDDATGTIGFSAAGSLSGNATVQALDYGSYGSAVNFDLAGGSGTTTGIGGSWSGVTSVAGSAASDTVTGSNQTYTLTGANAGNNGTVSWTSFENIADSGTGTLKATGATFNLSGGNSGTVTTLLPGGFSGIGNLDDATGTVAFGAGGSLSGNVTAQALDYGSYGSAVNFDLAGGSGTTTGIGGSWSGVTSVAGSAASDTVTGSNQTYTLTGANAGNNGTVSWTSFENIDDATAGTVAFHTGSSLGGNVTAKTLDYGSYGSAVNFDLSAGSGTTTGISGSWSGVTSVAGSAASDIITGSNQTYTLTGANAGNNGTVSWTSFENIADSGTGTLRAANQTWSLTGHNQGSVTDLSGTFSGIGNLTDTGSGAFLMHSGADGDISGNLDAGTGGSIDYTGYSSAVNVNVSGAGTTGVAGTVSGIASIAASSDLGVNGATAGSLDITTTGAGTTTTLGTLSTGTKLTVNASGTVLQSGALMVNGATTVNAGSNAIELTNSGNDFQGTVNLTGGTTQITDKNALTLGTLSTGDLTATSTGTLNLGTGPVGGALLATSNGGTITEGSGGVQVTGTSNLQAGTGAITLTDGNTHFGLAVTAAGQGVSLVDSGNLTIASLSSGTNGTVNLTAGGSLTLPALGIDTGTAALTLAANGGALVMPGALSGASIALSGRDGITLGSDLSSAGTVTLTSSSGAISQTGGVLAAGTLTGSSAGATTLGDANLVTALGSFSAAGFSLTNAQALTVNGAVSGGSSTTIDTAGNLDLGGNVSGTTTTLSAGGTIDQTAGIVTATTLNLGSVGGASLTGSNLVTNLGEVTNTGSGGLSFTNASGLNLEGAIDVGIASGNDLALAVTGNLTQSGGSVITANQLSGSSTGNTTLGGSNRLTTLGSFAAANLALTNAQVLAVNGPLSVPGTLSLTTTAGGLSLASDISAATVNLNSAAALSLANHIGATTLSLSSGGAISQSAGALTVTGTTTVNAGSHAITLTGSGNDFGGTVNLTGSTTQITDQNALTLGTLATGALTATSTGALDLGIGTVGGALLATSNGGAITEGSGGVQVTGSSNLQAGTGAITLADGSNHFTGAVTAAGQGVTLVDSGNLTVASLNSGTNGTVNLVADGALVIQGATSGANANLSGRDGITLGSNLTTAGTVTLTSGNGAISQTAGVITAGALTGSSAGDTVLGGANQIGTLGSFSAADFTLTNAEALTVGSNLVVGGGTGSIALTTTSGGLTVQHDLNGGAITLNSASNLSLAGNLAGSSLDLVSGGDIAQSAGVIQAGTLTGQAGGGVTLARANKIGTLGNVSAANGLSISNAQALTVGGTVNGGSSTGLTTTTGSLTTSGSIGGSSIALAGQDGLAIDGAVNAGTGDITLGSAAGAISEGSAGVLTAGSLSGTSSGSAMLGGANQVVTLGNFTTGGDFSFRDARTLTVNSPLDVHGGSGNLSLATSGASSDLILGTGLAGGTVTLTAGHNLTTSSGITANTLTGSAGGQAQLGGSNHVGTLGDFSAGSLTFGNAGALVVGGQVSTGSGALDLSTMAGNLRLAGAVTGGAVGLTSASAMAIDGTVSASTLALQAAGAITQSGGAITASSLSGTSGGSTTLDGANHVGSLGSFSAAGFRFTNAGALSVTGPIDGSSSTRLATTSGDLAINGQVSGNSTTLVSAGVIDEGAAGRIVASTLAGQSGGATTLGGSNSIDTLGSFSAAGLSLTNGKALSVGGPVNGGASASLTTTSGDLAVDGQLSATAVWLQSAGAITEGSGGVITASTLSGQSDGLTTLGTQSQAIGNQIDTLGNFSSTAGFSLTNAATLTLASVDNSAFTVDAGHAELYLGVTQGDLLAQGKTPIYDGTGTFASVGHMGSASSPIYVIGDGPQLIARVGNPPAYFYAVDRQGNILPLTGELSFNVPTSLFFGKAQNGNGRGDAYIDPSVISANYRSFGIVPSGILLPADQQACDPQTEDCGDQ